MLYEAIRPPHSTVCNKNNRAEQHLDNETKVSTVVSPVNGLCNPKNQNDIKKTEVQQNGNGIITNGVTKKLVESSDSDESDKDINNSNVSKNIIPLPTITSQHFSSNNSLADDNALPLYSPNNLSHSKKNGVSSEETTSENKTMQQDENKLAFPRTDAKNVSNNTANLTKLVPYEVNDSSSSSSLEESSLAKRNDNNDTISTKATAGSWKVSVMHDKVISPSLQGHSGWKSRNEPVNELIRMSHEGYTAPVTTWNGHRAQLDRQIANERREERKRCMIDNDDRGKVKHIRPNNSTSFQYSNSSYNPFQVGYFF